MDKDAVLLVLKVYNLERGMLAMKVMVAYKISPEELEIIEKAWPPEVEVVLPPSLEPEVLKPLLQDIEAVVGDFPVKFLLDAPKLKLIHTVGHGINQLLDPEVREYLLEKKVIVARASPGGAPIAEFIIASMVVLTRRLWQIHSNLAYHGSWSESIRAGRMKGAWGGELYGSTLGLIGFGNIGKETATRAKAFGMTIGALTRHPEDIDAVKYGIAFTGSSLRNEEVKDFLGRCDYIVNTMPLTPETRDFFDQQRFHAMKDGAYFINISRGPIVVEEALWEALRSGKLAGAALDVWRAEEGPGRREYPIPYPIHQYNVIMTPHYAGATMEVRARSLRNIGANLQRWLNNEALVNVADLRNGY